jgi:hypothetical protein
MPFKIQIADVERAIEETRAAIDRARTDGAGRSPRESKAEIEKLLVVLAKQKAERLRLMTKQRQATS